jgi:uncharacterized tellurite resistance protein B-like protein
MKDGQFQKAEIEDVSDKFVHLGLNTNLNFKDELITYRSYAKNITDETAYLEYLISLIHPVNALALYAYCAELVVSDQVIDAQEEMLLAKIAGLLPVNAQEQATARKLAIQRRTVELQKIF